MGKKLTIGEFFQKNNRKSRFLYKMPAKNLFRGSKALISNYQDSMWICLSKVQPGINFSGRLLHKSNPMQYYLNSLLY